jgi:hypothetical protein
MLDDAALGERLGQAGLHTVTEQFELKGLLDRYARLLEAAVGKQ